MWTRMRKLKRVKKDYKTGMPTNFKTSKEEKMKEMKTTKVVKKV